MALAPHLAQALALHQAGRLAEAAALYEAALARSPLDPDALHLLGVIRQQQGDFGASIALIGQALDRREDAAFASNLANAYLGLGRFEEAAAACRKAIALNAAFGMAYANLGVALRALGRPAEAMEALRLAIVIEPGRAEAQASLGVVLLELGRRAESIAVLRGLIASQPGYAPAHYNLGNSLAAEETPETLIEALASFDQAIALAPAYGEAHANRASILRRLGRLPEAEAAYRIALAQGAVNALTRYNLGLLLAEAGRSEEALAEQDLAIALAPDFAAAHSHRGNILAALGREAEAMAAHARALTLAPGDAALGHNLGLTLAHLGYHDRALAAQMQAIALRPDYADAYAGLVGCYLEDGRVDEALAAARKAVALDARSSMTQTALGRALLEVDDEAGARTALEAALALRPTYGQAHLNLGVLLSREGRIAEAEAEYRIALDLRPETWEAHFNIGTVRLQAGDYARGWPEFEYRLNAPDRRRSEARYPEPLWTDQDLAGRTILLHAEQGLGDVIQCARFIPDIAARGARIILEAPAALHRLFAPLAGVEALVEPGCSHAPADLRLPLFSLPHRVRATLQSLPGPMPYLQPPQALREAWGERLDALAPRPGPRVGVVWSGNVTAKVNRGRSIPLAAFAPLAKAVGAPLISLQKQYGLDELQALPPGMSVLTLGEAYDAGDMADTAAVIEALDLVVACDTSVAHLAGAVGAPTWLAINTTPDWRWLKDRSDSPWYPSLRVFRQQAAGDWDGVAEAMAAAWTASA